MLTVPEILAGPSFPAAAQTCANAGVNKTAREMEAARHRKSRRAYSRLLFRLLFRIPVTLIALRIADQWFYFFGGASLAVRGPVEGCRVGSWPGSPSLEVPNRLNMLESFDVRTK